MKKNANALNLSFNGLMILVFCVPLNKKRSEPIIDSLLLKLFFD